MMKVAIIGCGNVSTGHIAAWKDCTEASVALLVDVDPALARETRDKMGLDPGIPIATDYGAALTNDEIALVDICTPSHLHAEQIAAALQAGKHVVTEKPTGYDLEECRRLRHSRARYPEPKVAVAYSLRYYPLNIEVKRLIDAGTIGRPVSGQFTWNHPYDPTEVAEHGGPHARWLQDKGGKYIPSSEACGPTHVFDLARHLYGDVEEVFAYKRRFGIYAVACFENRAMGVLTAESTSSWGSRNPTCLCLQGTEGTIHTVMDRQGGYTGTLTTQDGETVIKARTDTGHGDRTRTENVVNAILRDEPLICPLEDSIRSTEFMHAIWDSHNLGIRVPVHEAGKTG
jgi:predicted dehydrogenase